jgi:hypothetical protein
MKEYHDRLTKKLMEKNDVISYGQALTWVELLWGDFEATYAKAGHKYAGQQMTFHVVETWINQYGERLHEFITQNPKYKDLLNKQEPLH